MIGYCNKIINKEYQRDHRAYIPHTVDMKAVYKKASVFRHGFEHDRRKNSGDQSLEYRSFYTEIIDPGCGMYGGIKGI